MEEKIVLQTEACRAEIALLGAQMERAISESWSTSGSGPEVVERLRTRSVPMVGALRGGPHGDRWPDL